MTHADRHHSELPTAGAPAAEFESRRRDVNAPSTHGHPRMH